MPYTVEPIALCLIFNNKDELLLVKSNTWTRDSWAIPGGHIEHGESILQAAIRESKEEVGADVTPLGVFTVMENVPEDRSHRHFILFAVVCLFEDGQIKPDGVEIAEFAWAPRDKIRTMLHGKAEIEMVLGYLKQKDTGKVNWVL